MKYYLYLRHDAENIHDTVSNDELANCVADTVIVFWNMARIKTKLRKSCARNVLSLWKEWRALSKNKSRSTGSNKQRSEYASKLDTLFDIGAADAVEEIMKSRLLSQEKKKEDVEFYF